MDGDSSRMARSGLEGRELEAGNWKLNLYVSEDKSIFDSAASLWLDHAKWYAGEVA
jgi:hypothetical protein